MARRIKRTIGGDTAKNTYGLAVLEGNRVCLGTAMLSKPVTSLIQKDFDPQRSEYRQLVHRLIRVFKPDLFVLERFQARPGGMLGATGEVVTAMIAITAIVCDDCGVEFRAIVSPQWKNGIKRAGVDLKTQVYPWGKQNGVPNHCLDAALVALYGANGNKYYSKEQIWRIVRQTTKDLPKRMDK